MKRMLVLLALPTLACQTNTDLKTTLVLGVCFVIAVGCLLVMQR